MYKFLFIPVGLEAVCKNGVLFYIKGLPTRRSTSMPITEEWLAQFHASTREFLLGVLVSRNQEGCITRNNWRKTVQFAVWASPGVSDRDYEIDTPEGFC